MIITKIPIKYNPKLTYQKLFEIIKERYSDRCNDVRIFLSRTIIIMGYYRIEIKLKRNSTNQTMELMCWTNVHPLKIWLPFVLITSGFGGIPLFVILFTKGKEIKAELERDLRLKDLLEKPSEIEKAGTVKSNVGKSVMSAEDKLKKAHDDGIIDDDEYAVKLKKVKLKKALDSGVLSQDEYDKKVSELG